MVSARNEAPKAPKGWSVRRGVLRGGVLGGDYAPSQFFLIFELKMASFGAFWELILL